MLVFIDEGGHPHPDDPTTRPVLAAVCFPEQESRRISRQIFGIKRSLLGIERAGRELKAHDLLNPRTFSRKPELRELVESVFDQVRNLQITIFAVIMEKPERELTNDSIYLPRQYRYILQRANALVSGRPDMALVLVDGDGSNSGGLSRKLESYLNRFHEGLTMTNVVDTPYFVDSKLTMGIQLADMVAGVIRQYEEAELFRIRHSSNYYLRAIARYYGIIESKTQELIDPNTGFTLQGIQRMPERLHYTQPGDEQQADVGGELDDEDDLDAGDS